MISWKLVSKIGIAGALALAAITWARAASREAAAEAAFPPTGQFVAAGGPNAGRGARVHVEILGQAAGTAPDLVLIHGASGSLRDMTFRLAPQLVDRYRIFAVDRPGFGYSTPLLEDTIHNQARAIRDAVAGLGAKNPIVMGHSYGGAVALAWAVDAPDTLRALVLAAAPSHLWPGAPPTLYRLTAPALGQRVLVPLITAWAPDAIIAQQIDAAFAPQHTPEGYAAHFGPRMTLRRETMRVNARERVDLKTQIGAMIAAYPDLSMPIELVHGDADTTVDLALHSKAFVRAVPTARLKTLVGQGHMIQQTASGELAAAIDRAADRSAP